MVAAIIIIIIIPGLLRIKQVNKPKQGPTHKKKKKKTCFCSLPTSKCELIINEVKPGGLGCCSKK